MSAILSRRNLLRAGTVSALGLAGAVALRAQPPVVAQDPTPVPGTMTGHGEHPGIDMPGFMGEINHEFNGFNPTEILTDFNYGDRISTLENGQTLREYDFIAGDKDVEVAPGILYPAWTYNGRIPGPTIRYSQPLAVLFLAIGAGAVFEVVYEIAKLIQKDTAKRPMPVTVFAGVAVGMLLL